MELADRPGSGERWRRVGLRLAFGIQGVGTLWPWNCLITVVDDFRKRLAGMPGEAQFPSVLATVFNTVGLGTVVLVTALKLERYAGVRIVAANAVVAGTFMYISAIAESQVARAWFAGNIIAAAGVLASAGAVYQNALFEVAGDFPVTCVQAAIVGQAVSGVLSAGTRLVTNVVGMHVEREEAGGEVFAFFMAAGAVAVLGMGAQAFVSRQPECRAARRHADAGDGYEPVAAATGGLRIAEDDEPVWDTERGMLARALDMLRQWMAGDIKIFRGYRYLFGAMLANFLVSLALFPAVASRVTSVNAGSGRVWADVRVFTPLAFLVWNLFDMMGRVVAGRALFGRASHSSLGLFCIAVARLVLVPALWVCNIDNGHGGHGLTVRSDAYFFAVLAVMGGTTGWLAGRIWLLIPEKLADYYAHEDRSRVFESTESLTLLNERTEEDSRIIERTNALMLFTLIFGVAGGSAISMLTTQVMVQPE